jgi:DNA modification methylase
MSVTVHHGDSRDVLKTLADASIDSVVCDPPYALVSIGKRFGAENAAAAKVGKSGAYARASAGFMGQKWDTGETAFDPAFWAEVFRVMKPGAHLIAFSGTRTYHRMACAIEDAGFEIRDQIGWLYGSGFPKSHDVAKGIDKAKGIAGERVATGEPVKRMIPGADQHKGGWEKNDGREFVPHAYAPGSDEAAVWQGWGTALKPAWEPIVLARKPLIGTVAANVLAHGTGALNIDASRIGTGEDKGVWPITERRHDDVTFTLPPTHTDTTKGRWPANVIHDGSKEVVGAFPPTAPSTIGKPRGAASGDGWGMTQTGAEYADSGSAARFFYSAKADAEDRLGSKHPTVKPVDLMAYLVRLVTPPGGLTLDPFAGSGSTGMACLREGFDCILIEREAQYFADIHRRLAHVEGADTPLFAAANAEPSLFDGEAA